MSANPSLYAIKSLPWREQVRDTYRVVFFPACLAVLTLILWALHTWFAVGVFVAPLIGGVAGMLPSLRHGTAARMPIAGKVDRAQIDAWLACRRHVRDTRGWVPKMPRALYFDSQIVHYDADCVIGPRIVLRKLRRMLRSASSLQG